MLSRDSAGLARTSVPGVPNLWRAITPSILARMGQVRSLSASTQRVDVDRVVARYIWRPDEEVTKERRSGRLPEPSNG